MMGHFFYVRTCMSVSFFFLPFIYCCHCLLFYPPSSQSTGDETTSQFLQADLATLQHLAEELTKAVKENRSAHSRRILRYVV